MNTPDDWMKKALELAKLAESRDEVPVGAILIHHHEILGSGFNDREATQQTLSHAELRALDDYNRKHKAWRLPPETSLFVTVEPCILCTGAMLQARVSSIFYGCSDIKHAGLGILREQIQSGRFDHRFDFIQGGILEAECREILSAYFASKRLNY